LTAIGSKPIVTAKIQVDRTGLTGGKMKKLIMIGLIFGVGTSLLLAGNLNYAYAGNYSPSIGSGFRCGNLLMSEGLDKLQVLASCGQPKASEKSYIDQYGEVEKLVYGPQAGYFYILYFFAGKLIGVEEVRQ
jgi:hypothetical protein